MRCGVKSAPDFKTKINRNFKKIKNMKDKTRILLLIDCQVDFIDGSLVNKDAQACIPAIVEKIDNFDGDFIILTMDTHGEDYLDTPEGKKLPVKHCIYNTEGWQINDKVQIALNRKSVMNDKLRVLFIPKNTFGSIYRDELIPIDEYLATGLIHGTLIDTINDIHTMENKNIDIEMCGFVSDICVCSNALILKAAAYDYADITVDSKCCAGVTPEKHEAALEVMRSCQINVV